MLTKRSLAGTLAIAASAISLTYVTPSYGAIHFYWKVAGKIFQAFEEPKKLFNVKLAKGVLKINGVDAKNKAYEVQCTVVTTEAGKPKEIFGGVPGSLEVSLIFEGCTIPKPGAPCAVKGKEIVVKGLVGQIVEGVGESKGLPLYWLGTSGTFTTINIEGTGCAVEAAMTISGTVLAQPKSEELKTQAAVFEPKERVNFSRTGTVCTNNAGLEQKGKAGNNAVTIEGEIAMELASEELFGPF